MDEPSDFPGVKDYVGSGHYYAFTTAQEMMRSIDRFMILRELKFNFVIYESREHLIMPDGQVAFRMSKATKLHTYAVEDFPYEEYF